MRFAMIGIAAVATLFGAGQAAAADGKVIYDMTCGACHNNLAPKLGDKEAWAPLAKNGADELVASVVKGKGAMPAKGGNTALSDDEVKAGVDYMTTAAK